MPVLSRSSSLTVDENGEIKGVLAENFRNAQPAFKVHEPVNEGGDAAIAVQRYLNNEKSAATFNSKEGQMIWPRGWGAGTRVLFTMTTCGRKPTSFMCPVIAFLPDEEKSAARPSRATLIEGASDPVICYDKRTGLVHLYYWVNAWSPPTNSNGSPHSTYESYEIKQQSLLFKTVDPPGPTYIDSTYLEASYSSLLNPPSREFTRLRDVPDWYFPGSNPRPEELVNLPYLAYPAPDAVQEPMGPFRMDCFWIAPWTDGHLYRFPKNYDPTPPPPVESPVPLQTPSPFPAGSPPPYDPSAFMDNFPFARIPDQETAREVNNVLYKMRKVLPITDLERATLLEYQLAPRRLAYLARTTRVLMHAVGHFLLGIKENDVPVVSTSGGATLPPLKSALTNNSQPLPYLVVSSPQPVLSTPRGVNKVLISRQKWLSWWTGEDVFITAPLNYKYPAAGTAALTAGDPQVDFTIHDPSANLDAYRRGAVLPDTDVTQRAPFVPEKTILVPRMLSFTLVDFMSNSSLWTQM